MEEGYDHEEVQVESAMEADEEPEEEIEVADVVWNRPFKGISEIPTNIG